MVGVSEVIGGLPGDTLGSVSMVGSQAPSPGPTASGQIQAGGPGGSWEGVEGSRASIWGSQRGARSHSGDPRPPALPAPETRRLEVQRGPEERSLKCPRGQGEGVQGSGCTSQTPDPTGSSHTKDGNPRSGGEVQEISVGIAGEAQGSQWGSQATGAARCRHAQGGGTRRVLGRDPTRNSRVRVEGSRTVRGSQWRSMGALGMGLRGDLGVREGVPMVGGPQVPRPAGSGHTQAEGPGQF